MHELKLVDFKSYTCKNFHFTDSLDLADMIVYKPHRTFKETLFNCMTITVRNEVVSNFLFKFNYGRFEI